VYSYFWVDIKMSTRKIDTGILGLVERSSSDEVTKLKNEIHWLTCEIKRVKQENNEWKDLLATLKDFNNWKQWKIGEG